MSEELEKGFAGKRKRKGCGLGCLTAIIVVVGMLAGSYLVSSHPYRHRAYNSSSNMDAKNAYTAAQKCFEDHPGGTVSTDILTAYGLRSTETVITTCEGTNGIQAIMTDHSSGDKAYEVSADSTIEVSE